MRKLYNLNIVYFSEIDKSAVASYTAIHGVSETLNLGDITKVDPKKLSKDIPFLRTDFYSINDKIYFGELTFFPASGFVPFEPEFWDKKLGDMINLPGKE